MADFEISTNGDTVWVNGKFNCLGRFSLNGLEVYKDQTKKEGNGMVYGLSVVTGKDEWSIFKAKVKELHDITVTDEYLPKRLHVPVE